MMSCCRAACVLAAVLAVCILADSRAPAGEKENAIVTKVKASVKDTSKPFALLIRLKIKDGASEKFEAAMAKAVKPTRKEKGCLAYDLSRNTEMASEYLLYEHWRNLDALKDHLKQPYLTGLLKNLGEFVDGPPSVQVFESVGH